MIKKMLNINEKISRDTSYVHNTWLRKPELEVEKIFNQQIFRKREVLLKIICKLSKKGLHEINKLENERESIFNQKIF